MVMSSVEEKYIHIELTVELTQTQSQLSVMNTEINQPLTQVKRQLRG